MKKLRDILGEKFSSDMDNWLKNNETTRKIKAREPTEPPKFAPLDPNWQEKMNNKFNAIINSKPVDFSGSRYGDEGIVSDQDKITRQNQNRLRRDYQQPPGYDTPAFDKAKERMAAADARDGEPPMPGSGPYKTKQSDPLKTPPIIVTPDKPLVTSKPNSALTAAGYDQSGKKITTIPKPKLRPERPSDVIPSGPGITTPGSMIYIEPKRQKLQDRVPQQKIQDRVPQQKLQDRVPPSAVNPKPTSAGPYAPAQSDDPFHQRYAKTASYLGQVPRDRKPPEKKEPIQNLYQINKGDTLEQIARKIGGKNWQETLKGIREKNPKIKERALKIGSELLLPESK